MKRISIAVAFLTIAVLTLALGGCREPRYPHGLEPIPKAGDLAEAVQNLHTADPIRFQIYHREDTVRTRGQVLQILADGVVKIGPTGIAKPALHCIFTQREDVIVLNPWDAVVITGQLDSVKERYVLLKRCTPDEHEPK